MTDIVIHTQGLTKKFGTEVAVSNVGFDLEAGKIFGFIGPSGSGKTTTVRLLTGVFPPTSGEVTVLGHPPMKLPRRVNEQIGYMPQQFVLFPELTVWENLNFVASMYGMRVRRKARLDHLLEFVNLTEHTGKLARNLSGGMQRRLGLAATLVHNPRLVFLDEPTAGVDPVLRRRFWDYFKELQKEGCTLFITTQYVGEATYCDEVGVMVGGRLVTVDTPQRLRRQALGGEVIDLSTKERLTHRDVERLQALPFVHRAMRLATGNDVRLIVEQAKTAIPALLLWCHSQNVAVHAIQEYLLPFDDVFVDLVKQESTHGTT